MTTPTFLGIAGARVDSLRQLSSQLHSLNWSSASLDEVEQEVPQLEVAMTVFRRLTAETAGRSKPGDPEGFLGIAGSRAEQLRQVSHEMQSLDGVHASLPDIENEIPDLELSISVYSRLTGEAADQSGSSAQLATAPAQASVGAGSDRDTDRSSAVSSTPTFSQFTHQSLEPQGAPAQDRSATNGRR